jgi:hypothetical protein
MPQSSDASDVADTEDLDACKQLAICLRVFWGDAPVAAGDAT